MGRMSAWSNKLEVGNVAVAMELCTSSRAADPAIVARHVLDAKASLSQTMLQICMQSVSTAWLVQTGDNEVS